MIIIPKALQNEFLLKLHASHQGTEKTKLRARSAVYWRDLTETLTTSRNHAVSVKSCRANKPKNHWCQQKFLHVLGIQSVLTCSTLTGPNICLSQITTLSSHFPGKFRQGKAPARLLLSWSSRYSVNMEFHVVRSDNGPRYNCYSF